MNESTWNILLKLLNTNHLSHCVSKNIISVSKLLFLISLILVAFYFAGSKAVKAEGNTYKSWDSAIQRINPLCMILANLSFLGREAFSLLRFLGVLLLSLHLHLYFLSTAVPLMSSCFSHLLFPSVRPTYVVRK